MNRIDAFFSRGRKAFIPYFTAGFPSVDASVAVMQTLVDNGADIIEMGYPFSDPTADGPAIQASSQAALDAGFHRDDFFAILRQFRAANPDVPVVVFGYYNPIFRTGVETFAGMVAEAGGDGMLIVDLPGEEQDEVLPALRAHGLHLIQLLAPTTPDARAARLRENAAGFVYQISVRGVTGMRAELGAEPEKLVARAKKLTDVPVALGFGVARGEQAATIARVADGVVVGSAIVKCIAEHGAAWQPALAALTRELAEATHGR
jgi:tryptophan synthase alpha chain